MNAHYDLDEVECPECKGLGFSSSKMGFEECSRCNGTGKIQIKIRKLDIEEESDEIS